MRTVTVDLSKFSTEVIDLFFSDYYESEAEIPFEDHDGDIIAVNLNGVLLSIDSDSSHWNDIIDVIYEALDDESEDMKLNLEIMQSGAYEHANY